jgi:hypothetical protein
MSTSKPTRTSYSRRRHDYLYDIEIHETAHPATAARRFCAHVVNMVRLESGATVSVVPDVSDQYAATRAYAVMKLEAAVNAWVEEQMGAA